MEPQNIAVILADETLLNPVLSILPEAYEKVNITMGYPLDQTKVAATVRLWIGAIEYALKNEKSGKTWTYYHRSLSNLLGCVAARQILGQCVHRRLAGTVVWRVEHIEIIGAV